MHSNWKQRILYFHGEARWDCTPASTMQKNVQCRLKKIKRTPRHLKLRSSSPVHPNRDFARALERLRQWLCIGCNFLNVIWFPSLSVSLDRQGFNKKVSSLTGPEKFSCDTDFYKYHHQQRFYLLLDLNWIFHFFIRFQPLRKLLHSLKHGLSSLTIL